MAAGPGSTGWSLHKPWGRMARQCLLETRHRGRVWGGRSGVRQGWLCCAGTRTCHWLGGPYCAFEDVIAGHHFIRVWGGEVSGDVSGNMQGRSSLYFPRGRGACPK